MLAAAFLPLFPDDLSLIAQTCHCYKNCLWLLHITLLFSQFLVYAVKNLWGRGKNKESWGWLPLLSEPTNNRRNI